MADDEYEVKSYPGPAEGQYSTIFSSKGDPDDDDGHGHITVDDKGNVTYARETEDNGGEEGWID
jgi:hypothetical protein